MRRQQKKPLVNQADITKTMRELGIQQGDYMIVHSSLNSFGYVDGGADTVIDALIQTVGENGGVFVPTLTGTRHDGPNSPPHFHVKHTPTWTGRIPETLRKRKNARRSLHPTHSLAGIGHRIDTFLAQHEACETPCGRESPYFKLAQHGGYIVLIGVDQQANTTIHTAEELARVPYHLQPEPTPVFITDYDNTEQRCILTLHCWQTPRDFQRIDRPLRQKSIMRIGRIGNAQVRVIRSLPMVQWLTAKLQRDPTYLCV